MNVLLIGGSGHVGTMTLPYMKEHHNFRILDPSPPKDNSVDYIQGSATDVDIVQEALKGIDTFVYMVMLRPTSDRSSVADFPDILANYDVNAKGLHIVLHAAKEIGIQRAVYTSTFTVHERTRNSYPYEDLVPRDNPGVYGLTKSFGEQVCEYFCREHNMSLSALRITGPSTREQWLERREQPKDSSVHIWWTDEEDLANAYLAAISAKHDGFEAFFIAGDYEQNEINLSKSKRLLGWEPLTHTKYK
ncbi:NAD(P)-dependent oxidoreductase [Candidatus Poribacteria bacterium]|nr:NAD(P)-dependent oxidoreductase [Candidatus Poribacteria bacterium]